MEKRLEEILENVHQEPSFVKYKETNVRKSTNCYSHALGTTLPYLELYRVGRICGKKEVDEEYFSIDEIKRLLFLDCEALNLKIEQSSKEEVISSSNQYKIALFVKTWGNGVIGDYHFWRCDANGTWTEKWRGMLMDEIQNFERDKKDCFPWSFEGIYKISR